MGKENNKVDVMLLMRESCALCQEVLTKLTSYMKNKVNIDFRIIDLDKDNNYTKKNSSITPAIWVNDKMWYAGSVNIERFDKKINELINLQ
jgi:glutaredoxin